MWDTGSSVGDLSGHGKAIQSCDIRQVRPYRVATGSEDFTVNWFEGPPFKFNKTIKVKRKILEIFLKLIQNIFFKIGSYTFCQLCSFFS